MRSLSAMELLGLLVGGFIAFLILYLQRLRWWSRPPARPHVTFLIISALVAGYLVAFAIEFVSGRLSQIEARSFVGLAVFYLGCAAGYAVALKLPFDSPQPEARWYASTAETSREANITLAREIDALSRERAGVKSEGKLDAAATLRIEARPQTLSSKENAIDQLPKPLQVLLWAVVALLAIGTLLELVVGDSFIFSGSNEYRKAVPWLLALSTPILWLGMLYFYARALVAVPFVASMVVLAPLGWVALAGWMVGERSVGMEARVIAIQTPSKGRRGCDQHAHLEFRGVTARVCVERRVSVQPSAGETVRVSGLLSPFGLYVEHVDPK